MSFTIKEKPGLETLETQIEASIKKRDNLLQQQATVQNQISEQLARIENSGAIGETLAAVAAINTQAQARIRELDRENSALSRKVIYFNKRIEAAQKQERHNQTGNLIRPV